MDAYIVLVVERRPVEPPVPLVLLDVLGAVLQVAYALRSVRREQLAHQVARMRLEVTRELELALQDLLVDTEGVLVVKRRVPGQHLVDEDAQCPPIDALAVAFALDDLGREVLGRAAEGPRPVLYLLGEAKIGDLEVAGEVEQQVLGLEIAVDNAVVVQRLQRHDDLRGVEARVVVVELASLAQVREELTSDDVLE